MHNFWAFMDALTFCKSVHFVTKAKLTAATLSQACHEQDCTECADKILFYLQYDPRKALVTGYAMTGLYTSFICSQTQKVMCAHSCNWKVIKIL